MAKGRAGAELNRPHIRFDRWLLGAVLASLALTELEAGGAIVSSNGRQAAQAECGAPWQDGEDVLDSPGGTAVDWLGNTWTRAGSPDDVGGPGEANWYVDLLATGDVSMIQYAVDRYYRNAPPGTPRRWGKGWLAKHVAVVLLMRAFELRSALGPELAQGVDRLAVDALDEATFRIDGCGVLGNSCAEDFASMLALAAIARNLFPGVVAALGDTTLERIEKRYLTLTLTTRNRSFGLVREVSPIDGREYALVQNHGGQSAVYSAIVLTQVGNALHAYLAAGRRVPGFYTEDQALTANLRSMMAWLQTTALPDGSAFVSGCVEYASGQAGPCNDPAFANAVPTQLPAGRPVALLFGEAALGADYRFTRFAANGPGGATSAGRAYQYDAINPEAVDAGLAATVTGSTAVVRWSDLGAPAYDLWGPAGRVTTTTGTTSSFDLGGARGRIPYGLVVRGGSGLVAGYELESFGRFTVRRRLPAKERTFLPRFSLRPAAARSR